MSTPQDMLGGGTNSYNTLSNNQIPPSPPTNQNQANPTDDLTNQFATPFSQFSTLIENYPSALNEGRAALQALYNWLDKAMSSLNSGTETTQPNTSNPNNQNSGQGAGGVGY